MSKREEDFIEAGIAYRMEHNKPMCIAGSNLVDVERDFNRVISFEAGCEYGYQYAVDKACEWLEQHAYLYVDDIDDQLHESELIADFRLSMEE